ncbi:MAG: S-layer homology domain-containing protein [Clostridia bacterium]|nr:S-layer homology domain-containing protein [Clostridia bacterium]
MKKGFLAVLVAITMLAAMMSPVGVMAEASEVTKTYFDIDFESWTTWETTFDGAKQSDGSSINHDWGGEPYRLVGTEVPDREGIVMKATIPTSGGSSDGYLLRSRMKVVGGHPSNYNNVDVLWNEFSIKYEGGFIGFGTNENDSAYNIISINKNGQLVLGARWGYNEIGGGNHNGGTVVSGGQLELGKWYHVAVAADFTDSNASYGVPTYIWLNGELISDGATIPSIVPGANWAYNKLWFDQAETAGTIAYIDNIKVYETAELDDHVAINITDENPDDYITVENSEIKTPSKATIGDIKAAFSGVNFRFEKDGVEVTDDAESVSGIIAYVYSTDGSAARPYTLSPAEATIPVTVSGGYAGENSGAGLYSMGDNVTIDAGALEGQRFTGWTVVGIELDDSTKSPVTFVMTEGEKSFTANWEAVETYKVDVIDSFAEKSGAGQYYDGQKVIIDAGDRPGYIFDGWVVEGAEIPDTTSKTIEIVMDTVPKKFTAIWKVIPKYKVDVIGSYAEVSGAGEYYEGQTVTINAGDTNRAEFTGWISSGVTLADSSAKTITFEMPANDVSVTAGWYSYSAPSGGGGGGGGGGGSSTASYKVKFETNGGSVVDTVEVKKGETVTPQIPTKEGFSFDGWYLDSKLTKPAPTPYEVTGNVTLYAKWTEKTEGETEDEPSKGDEPAKDDNWLNPFNDVKENSWYYEPIRYMYERQYCEGFGWGQFGPDVNLSRSMLVTILYRIEKQPEVSSASTFADVEDGAWYTDAVVWAAENGIVTGYNANSFAPDDLITREQIATILYRYAQFKGESTDESADISAFDDADLVSSYARSSLGWAVENGYINGRTETTVAPADNATRAEALTVLYRFIKN